MIDIIVVGEDEVTREIIKRLLDFSDKGFQVFREEPVRGSQIKEKFLNYNLLSNKMPVFVLMDSDNECSVALRNNLLKENTVGKNMLFRIAYFEAELWLMADRKGFAEFLKIKSELIPMSEQIDKKKVYINELNFPYKPSLYLMTELVSKSKDADIKQKLTPKFKAKKGPEYNSTIVPFIKNKWNIDEAMKNSYSLRKAIERIRGFQKS